MEADLHIVAYSKHNSVEKVRIALLAAPKQEDNSPDAWDGRVFELQLEPGGKVGTLSEYYVNFGIDVANIYTSDGCVTARRGQDGTWWASLIVRL